MHSAGRFTQNYPHSNFGQSKPGWPWQGYSLWPGDRISLQMKVTIPTKAQVLCPVLIFRNKSLSRSGRCRLGSIGRKRKKNQYSFSLKFCREIQCKLYSPSSTHKHRTEITHGKKSNLSRKSFPREIIISIAELWQAGEIWRDIKKDLRIMITVRKLDTARQSNRTVRFDAAPFAVSRGSWGQKQTGLPTEPL